MKARGQPLRNDDSPDVLRRRLLAYRDQTAPLVTYYKLQSVLRTIDGMAAISDVADAIDRVLRKPAAGKAAAAPSAGKARANKQAGGKAAKGQAKPEAKAGRAGPARTGKTAAPKARAGKAKFPKSRGKAAASGRPGARKSQRQRRLTKRR
jgi:adenylate kinase